MRCLTLADALHEQGADCVFICRAHTGHLLDLIVQRGHKAIALPAPDAQLNTIPTPETEYAHWLGADWHVDAQETQQALEDKKVDWLVVDHYALDARWEKILRGHCQQMMVIDDLANRSHDCDLLLDQTFGRATENYHSLVPANCHLLCGSQYALLRPEFAKLRPYSLQRRRTQPDLRKLLINMGGVDKDNATTQVLQALCNSPLPSECQITVVMGTTAPWLEDVQNQAKKMPWPTRVLVGVRNMAQLMADSDLAIGAAGSTSLERCCLGLPTLMLVLAENQLTGAATLHNSGAAIVIQSANQIAELFDHWQTNQNIKEKLEKISELAASVTHGFGTIHITEEMTRRHRA